ncbi:hypothetical protein CSC81_18855, partial [Tenacibaculum discolor]
MKSIGMVGWMGGRGEWVKADRRAGGKGGSWEKEGWSRRSPVLFVWLGGSGCGSRRVVEGGGYAAWRWG